MRVSPFEDLLFWGLRRSKIRVTLVSLEKPKEIPLGELFQAFNMIQSVYKRRIQEDQCFSYNNLSLRAVAISAVLKYDQPLYSHAGCTDLYLSTSRLSTCSINHQFFYLLNANLFSWTLLSVSDHDVYPQCMQVHASNPINITSFLDQPHKLRRKKDSANMKREGS